MIGAAAALELRLRIFSIFHVQFYIARSLYHVYGIILSYWAAIFRIFLHLLSGNPFQLFYMDLLRAYPRLYFAFVWTQNVEELLVDFNCVVLEAIGLSD